MVTPIIFRIDLSELVGREIYGYSNYIYDWSLWACGQRNLWLLQLYLGLISLSLWSEKCMVTPIIFRIDLFELVGREIYGYSNYI